ncbi:S-layer homology domain-containing protein [Paenibacillus hemerocallicola]|nr:S-layer homology domain-containing protein [Paenibacillus hemerocallicola]
MAMADIKRSWKKKLSKMLVLTMAAGSLSNVVAPREAAAAPGGPLPTWASNAEFWLKADEGVTTATYGAGPGVEKWDNQAGTVQFDVYGGPGYKVAGTNFNPVVTFTNTGNAISQLSQYLLGNGQITYADAYAVFKADSGNSGAVVGSTTRSSGHGAALFAVDSNGLYLGHINGQFKAVSYPAAESSRYQLVEYDASGTTDTVTVTGDKRNLPDPDYSTFSFTPLIGGTKEGSSGRNYYNYNGELAEVIVFSGSTASNRNQIQSYLALKYGLTLNGGGSDYVDSNGTTVWSAASNTDYKNRITGIGRDSGSTLNQRQSKSQDTGALVTIAAGNAIQTSNQGIASGIIDNGDYLIFGDNGNSSSTAYQTAVAGTNIKRMDRVFKATKTGNWAGKQITFQLGAAAPAGATHLLVSGNGTFDSSSAKYQLSATGQVTINSGDLSATSYFTFAKEEAPVQAPGGVASGLLLWLNPASVGATVANGGAVAEWKDLSGTDNHAVQAVNGNQPVYYNNAANNVNFNPVVKFDGANEYLDLQGNKLPQGTTPRTIVAVGQTAAASANKYLISWGTGSPNSMMGMMQLGTKGALSGYGAPYASPDGFWKQGIPNELFGMWEGNAGGKLASLYSRMGLLDSSQMTTWNTSGSSARVGAIVGSLSENWQGAIGDVMVYNRVLTDSERQRISTYLALKYGYMIDQAQGQLSNYIASDGTGVVWDAAANSAYKNNIAGIGRDDTGLLNQRQSHSTNSGQQVTVGLNAIAATNSDNAASFPMDKQYLIWGDNGKTLTTFGQTIQIADSSYWKPAERVWKVQNTNNVGAVQFSIAKSAFPAGTTASEIKLLVGSDAGFATAAAIAVQESGDAFVADNVVLPNGYFTFAKVQAPTLAPGGVTNKPVIWLKAKDAVPAGNGSELTGWSNKAGDAVFTVDGALPGKPSYLTAGVNFYPVVAFNGNARLVGDQNVTMVEAYTVTAWNGAKDTNRGAAIAPTDLAGDGYGSYFFDSIGGSLYAGNGNGTYLQAGAPENGEYGLWTASFPNTMRKNGLSAGTGSTGAAMTGIPQIGNRKVDATVENYLRGNIAEVIVLNSAATADERSRIESYLALKYGLTLNDGATDYVASNFNGTTGTNMWTAAKNAGYGKRITGIGKDTASGLEQKQSKSQESGALVTIAAGNEIKASNEAYPDNTITNDRSFLTFSDDGGDAAYSAFIASTNLTRMARTFKVDKTNWNDGNVTLQLDGTQAGQLNYVIIGGDSGFTGTLKTAQLVDGKATINSSDLADGSYFTFARTNVQSKAPGGVNGASLWIKADKDAAADGAGQLTGWTDQTGTNQFTVNGAPAFKADAVNFNPAVTLHNTTTPSQNPNEYLKGDTPIAYQDGYAVYKQQDGTIVGSAAPRAGGYGVGIFTKWGSKTYIGNGGNSKYRGFAFKDASRYYMASFDAAADIAAQGKLNGTAQTVAGDNSFNKIDFTPVIGGTFGGGSPNNWSHYKGDIAEIVLFPASNTPLEKQRVESYLALKYGMTLNGGKSNYVASNGSDTMWTAGNNAGFGNRITGIGRDDGSELLQKQSKSQDKEALVTIALGDAIQLTNPLNANTIDADMSFFTFSDNGAIAKYEESVLEIPGHTLKQLNRVFKVEKTKWQDKNITLKLNTTAENPAVLYYLVIDGANTGMKLDAADQVTIDSSMLANGSTFTFAKVYKNLLKAKINEVKSLKEANYTPDSWAVLQNALANAEAVLNNPGSTQEQVDAALAALEAARAGLSTGADKLKAKSDEVQNEITLGSLKPGDYTAGSWQALTGALDEAKALLARTPQATAVELGQALAKLEAARGTLVDLSQLRAKEAAIVGENLQAGQYTADSWQALQQALTNARAVLSNPNATQAEVDAAKAELEAARAALVPGADKTALLARANEVKGFTEANYTPESWAALQQAMSVADAVLNDPNATQAEVDAAKAALEAAIAGLGSTLPGLQNKVNAVKGEISTEVLKPGDYTADSWQALNGALAEAEALVNRTPPASESELGQALSKLEAARGALVDLSGLRAKEAEASGVTAAVYTANSWQALQVVLTDARAVLVKPNATQTEVDAAKASLEAAIAALVPAANKAALLAKVNEVKGENLRDADYTPESLAALKQAIAAAEAVLNDPNATQQQVDAARDALDAARKNIVARGAKLSALTVFEADSGKPVALSPAFDPNQSLNYAGVVSNAVYGVGIVPTAHTPNSTIKVSLNGQPAAEADWSKLPLKEGLNTVKVEVTDPESNKNDYTIEIMRTTSKLVSLTPSSGNLEPAFNPDTGAYTMRVSNGVNELSWTPVALDPNATIEISVRGESFTPVASGAKSIYYGLFVGDNTFVVQVTDRNGKFRQYTITVTRASSSVWGNGGTTGTGTGSGKSADIATNVNGNEAPFATGTAGQTAGRTQTTVQIDPAKLNDILSQSNGQQLSIRVPNDGDVGVNGLTAAQVKRLADSGSSLEVGNHLAIYPVPGGQMDLNGASQKWNNAPFGDIEVHVGIKRASDALIGTAKDKAKGQGYELLVDPVDLELSYSYKGQTVGAGELNGYGVRYIALPDGIDPNRITTGVIVNPDGTMFHVPTVVTKINSRYYAMINDLRSSGTYSVIWNPQDFDDVRNHWARAAVNDIAARLDLAGTGNNTFSPDRNVNRSEFAAIVALGMGLMRQNVTENMFGDVTKAAWYHDAVTIASEFGIVLGYEDSLFRGDQRITREQGIAMISRAYSLVSPQNALSGAEIEALLEPYGDAANISGWAREAVARMVAVGLVEGSDGQLLKPLDSMTRAEAAALMRRLLQTTKLID